MNRRDFIHRVATVFLLGLLLLGAPAERARAQSSVGTPSPIVPLLWQVDGPGSTLYLYGSIHIAPADVLPPPRVVREAFSRSALLVTEIPITEDMDVALEAALASRMFLPEGRTLEGELSPEEWATLEQWSSAQGIPTEMVRTMQPWALELLVDQTASTPRGFSTHNGLDTYFASKATARGLETTALETVEDQIDVLAGGSLEEQLASLIATIAQADPLAQTLELYEAWRSGDEDALQELVDEGLDGPWSGSYERLLTDRNAAWTRKLVRLLEKEGGPRFVVVGAAHLVGMSSVQALLAEEGYPSRRLLEITDLYRTPATGSREAR